MRRRRHLREPGEAAWKWAFLPVVTMLVIAVCYARYEAVITIAVTSEIFVNHPNIRLRLRIS